MVLRYPSGPGEETDGLGAVRRATRCGDRSHARTDGRAKVAQTAARPTAQTRPGAIDSGAGRGRQEGPAAHDVHAWARTMIIYYAIGAYGGCAGKP